LEKIEKQARDAGDLRTIKRIMAITAVIKGFLYSMIATIIKVSKESVRIWFNLFMQKGINSLNVKKPGGRKPNLTKSQRKELKQIIINGPSEAGFPGGCWRSPMIQDLIFRKYGVFYNVHYISQLLRNMGLSYQKGKFESDHKDPEMRKEWLEKDWPEILSLAKKKDACILFGDEASFPQWGSLSYTWAEKGKQPLVKTSGIRKGYKVFGLIDYFSGRFFYKCHEGRLNSESYGNFIKEVLSKTKQHIILIQDGAKYHTSAKMNQIFKENEDRITVKKLPSYSPDYNPIEALWKKIKEKGTHLKYFPTFKALKDKVEEMLFDFQNTKEEVLSLFGFYKKMEAVLEV
jgi:transposase